MKTKEIENFNTVQFMRDQREALSIVLSKTNKAEVIAYFKEKREKKGIRPNG